MYLLHHEVQQCYLVLTEFIVNSFFGLESIIVWKIDIDALMKILFAHIGLNTLDWGLWPWFKDNTL